MAKSKLTLIERVNSIKAWVKKNEYKQPVGFFCNINPKIREHAYRFRHCIKMADPNLREDDLVWIDMVEDAIAKLK